MIYWTRVRNLKKASSGKRFLSSQEFINKDKAYGGLHCKTLPVVLERDEGVYVFDVDGKRYLDFLAGFATLNQGHCHPRLVKTIREQSGILTHTSRAYHSMYHGQLCEYLTKLLGFDRFLPMNTGNEAGETALKIEIYSDFGPYMPKFKLVPYDDLGSLEKLLKEDENICAYMMEPIQGEAGVIIPKVGYLKGVRDLCTKYNVLWIADEVQTGLGRTGRRLACDHEGVKPDILILGKALFGGMYPFSGVLTHDQHMLSLKKGSHGSTFGGNPLGMRLAIEAVKIIEEEKLADNAHKLKKILKAELEKVPKEIAAEYRVKGLMAALVLREDFANGWDICLKLLEAGLWIKL